MTARFASLFLILGLALTGCSGKKDKESDGPEKDKKGEDTGVKQTDAKGGDSGSTQPGKPDFKVTAKEFSEDYEKRADNPGASSIKKKYHDKTIEVTGKVKHFSLGFLTDDVGFTLEGASG